MKYLKKFPSAADYEAFLADGYLEPNVSLISDSEEVKYNKPYEADLTNPILNDNLTFIALEKGLRVGFSLNPLEYCVDGSGIWNTLPVGEQTPPIKKGHSVSLRGEISAISESEGIGTFNLSHACSVRGAIRSLTSNTNAKNNQFYKIFYNCSTLVDASELVLPSSIANYYYAAAFMYCTNLVAAPKSLPYDSLPQGCFSSMFAGCTNLVNPPIIAATTAQVSCAYQMFKDCENLETAPVLNFTQITQGACNKMFTGCSKLSYIKCLATYVSGGSENWVEGVAENGTFVKLAGTSIPTGINGIPEGWTVENI